MVHQASEPASGQPAQLSCEVTGESPQGTGTDTPSQQGDQSVLNEPISTLTIGAMRVQASTSDEEQASTSGNQLIGNTQGERATSLMDGNSQVNFKRNIKVHKRNKIKPSSRRLSNIDQVQPLHLPQALGTI